MDNKAANGMFPDGVWIPGWFIYHSGEFTHCSVDRRACAADAGTDEADKAGPFLWKDHSVWQLLRDIYGWTPGSDDGTADEPGAIYGSKRCMFSSWFQGQGYPRALMLHVMKGILDQSFIPFCMYWQIILLLSGYTGPSASGKNTTEYWCDQEGKIKWVSCASTMKLY